MDITLQRFGEIRQRLEDDSSATNDAALYQNHRFKRKNAAEAAFFVQATTT